MRKSGLAAFAIDLDIKTHEVYACVFTRDGRRAVTGAQGNPVRVWDVETGRNVVAFDDRSVGAWAVRWSQDERDVFVGGRDGTVQMWMFSRDSALRCSRGTTVSFGASMERRSSARSLRIRQRRSHGSLVGHGIGELPQDP